MHVFDFLVVLLNSGKKHHWLYRQVLFQICMHIEGVCIREGRQANAGDVAGKKAADDAVPDLCSDASDVEGADGGADVAAIGDSYLYWNRQGNRIAL